MSLNTEKEEKDMKRAIVVVIATLAAIGAVLTGIVIFIKKKGE